MSKFDYGNTKPDGQYENYPTNTSGEFVAPVQLGDIGDIALIGKDMRQKSGYIK
jgi:hypothetical protein